MTNSLPTCTMDGKAVKLYTVDEALERMDALMAEDEAEEIEPEFFGPIERLTYLRARRGAARRTVQGGYIVTKVTPKTCTIFRPRTTTHDLGAKFNSPRSYRFRWDGTGYVRRGEYLTVDM